MDKKVKIDCMRHLHWLLSLVLFGLNGGSSASAGGSVAASGHRRRLCSGSPAAALASRAAASLSLPPLPLAALAQTISTNKHCCCSCCCSSSSSSHGTGPERCQQQQLAAALLVGDRATDRPRTSERPSDRERASDCDSHPSRQASVSIPRFPRSIDRWIGRWIDRWIDETRILPSVCNLVLGCHLRRRMGGCLLGRHQRQRWLRWWWRSPPRAAVHSRYCPSSALSSIRRDAGRVHRLNSLPEFVTFGERERILEGCTV